MHAPLRTRHAAWMLLAAVAAGPGIAAARCPDLSGRFHVVGDDHAVKLVLAALQSREAASRREGIALDGPAGGALKVSVRGEEPTPWPSVPGNRLGEGTDFRCEAGSLRLLRPQPGKGWRDDAGEWYRGSATISLARHPDGGLQVRVRFDGHQTVTIYRYDSATASVPKPLSGRRFDESLYWPAWGPDDDQIRRPPPPEPGPVRDLRQRLDRAILGNVWMGTPQAVDGGMLVRFTAPRSADVVAFEDRLRTAAIRYESREAPVWTNNAFHMVFLIDGDAQGHGRPSVPSPLRVEHELRSLAQPLAQLVRVEAEGDGYLATLRLERPGDADALVSRLRQHARLFAEVALLAENASPANEVRLRLRAF